jgi:hypothetical protein
VTVTAKKAPEEEEKGTVGGTLETNYPPPTTEPTRTSDLEDLTFTAKSESEKGGNEKLTPEELRTGANILSHAIVGIHHALALRTGYEGWELDAGTVQAWDLLGSLLLKEFGSKYLLIGLAVLQVGVGEAGCVMGWLSWRKRHPSTLPDESKYRPPPPAEVKLP